jgi:hypothetical protein
MAATGRQGALLATILDAGGPAMRVAAEERARRRRSVDVERLEQSA